MARFVVFLPDQLRADALAPYGNAHTTTPAFARLASEGVRFDQCHTQSVLCTPSRCSMLTGWYPHVAGHRSLWHLLQPHEPNLFRRLREAGYHVAHFGKNDVFAPGTIASSLDEYTNLPGSNNGPNPWPLDDPRRYSFLVEPFPGSREETKDARHVSLACDYLRRRAEDRRDFLLFVPLTLPHPPYGPPEPYASMVSPDDVAVRPVRTDRVPTFHELVRSYRRLNELDESFFRRIRAVYYGMVEYVDWMLGKVMRTLDETGLAEETWLFVAADHGDLAGDYGLVEKIHNAHYDPLTRVPLLVRGPGASAGTHADEPVALMDLMATILDLAGVDATHSHFSRSLVPQLRSDESDRASAPAAVFTENGFRVDESHCFEGSMPGDGTWDPESHYYPQTRQLQEVPESMDRVVTIRTAHDKLCFRPDGVSEYYDLETDPLESVNRIDASECRERVAALEREILAWQVRTADAVPFHHDPRGFPAERGPA